METLSLFQANNLKQDVLIGLGYSGFREGQSPVTKIFPTESQIREDLQLIRNCKRIRIYSCQNPVNIPRLAEEYGLEVNLGVWINNNKVSNKYEILRALKAAKSCKAVTRVIVGSKALTKEYLSTAELVEIMKEIREELKVPVGTSESWSTFAQNPELSAASDFLAVHIFPLWLGVSAEEATQYIADKLAVIRSIYPKKKIILSDHGWASKGQRIHEAVPSLKNQRLYLENVLAYCRENNIEQYYFEAFDEKWKRGYENELGTHWGIYDINRKAKNL